MYHLNNKFASREEYDDLLQYYLTTGVVPASVASASRFRKKYAGFALKDGKIEYAPLALEVVPKDAVEQTLEAIYQSDDAAGKGTYSLYKFVQQKYMGITRDDVIKFLSVKSNYQMTQPTPAHRINKPIVAQFLNQIWCIDLIQWLPNEPANRTKFKYSVTVVDVFSRYCWLEPIKTKDAISVKNAFEKITKSANITPDYLISDNGGEFKAEFSDFCVQNKIGQRFVRPHSPQANGVCERRNGEVRKITKALMVKTGEMDWKTLMPRVQEVKNRAYNSAIKGTPFDIWQPNKNSVGTRILPFTAKNKQINARVNIARNVKKRIDEFEENDNFEVGQIVRVKTAVIFNDIRKKIKANDAKGLAITYTPELFRVVKVIVPRKTTLERKRYLLQNADGDYIRSKTNVPHQFYASDLLLFDSDKYNDAEITMEEALEIYNGSQKNANDLVY